MKTVSPLNDHMILDAPEPEDHQPPDGDCSASVCSAFQIGDTVEYQGEPRTVYDVDEGYGMLALDGDKYIAPSHPDNRCIEAPMGDCKIFKQNTCMTRESSS